MDSDYNYIYEDKLYEAYVKNLKATFFDILNRQETYLNRLENAIANTNDQEVKMKLLNLWSKQNDTLDDSLKMVNKLTKTIRVLDSFHNELIKIEEEQKKQELISSVNKDDTKQEENVEQSEIEVISDDVQQEVKVPDTVEELQEIVPNEGEVELQEVASTTPELEAEEIVSNDAQQEVIEEEIKPVEEIVNQDFDFTLDENTENLENVDNQNISDEVIEESESQDELLDLEITNEENDGMDLPDTVEVESIEKVNEDPQLTEQVALEDNVELPFQNIDENGNFVENTQSQEDVYELPEPDAIDNQIEVVDTPEMAELVPNNIEINEESIVENEEASNVNSEVSLENISENPPIIEETSELKISNLIKNDFNQVKAIIVNGDQFNKLSESLNNQEARLYGEGIVNNEIIENTNRTINGSQGIYQEGTNAEIVEVYQESVDNKIDEIGTVYEEEPDMEAMLEHANQLYKSGQTEAAQALYDQISQMNQATQANTKTIAA